MKKACLVIIFLMLLLPLSLDAGFHDLNDTLEVYSLSDIQGSITEINLSKAVNIFDRICDLQRQEWLELHIYQDGKLIAPYCGNYDANGKSYYFRVCGYSYVDFEPIPGPLSAQYGEAPWELSEEQKLIRRLRWEQY